MDDAQKNAPEVATEGTILIHPAPGYQMVSAPFWPEWSRPGINGSNRKKNT